MPQPFDRQRPITTAILAPHAGASGPNPSMSDLTGISSDPRLWARAPRRHLLKLAVAGLALPALAPVVAQTVPRMEVWKDPNCGCCKDWMVHLERNGFRTQAHDTGNNAARQRLGMPQKYASCHTGLIEQYVIEGHVPAREIHRLLRERPQALGLAVPGMPVGSPGMDGKIYGDRKDRYDVLLIARDGSSRVFQSY